MVLAGALVLMLSGCDFLPTNNTDKKPVAIKADGTQYYTCSVFSLSSSSSWGGATTYELSFHDPSRGGGKVELKGIAKVEIVESPALVEAQMPSALPDIKTDHDSGNNPYQEGNIYTFADGSQAQVKNGNWAPIKVPNPICTVVK